MAETRDSADRSFLSGFKRGDGRPTEFGKYIRANWPALVMLLFVFVLALFVRSYFAYSTSVDNGYLYSGGSDSYYWKRILDYNAETGKQLFFDPMINYPDGIRNPRPPLYSFTIVVSAVVSQGLFETLSDSVGFMLVWSTAFWGALTVFPVYLLAKEAFGRRAGLAAAFFLAVMPSHVQRSVLSNADHDAIIQFFMVLTFFFLLKAVKVQEHRKWVENWRSLGSIRTGFKDYFANSRTAVLYALMAGVSFGCIIMTWIGFAYVAVLILAYYVVEVLFNRFKNVDSMGVTIIIFLAMGLGYLMAFPVYYEQQLIFRLDVTLYLFLAAIALGSVFVVTREYPWTLVVPVIGVLVVAAILAISVLYPPLAEAILSGQGYFGTSKLYSTISEVRAPRFSELAMSFGMVTFYLSLVGLIWAIVKLPKRSTAPYLFMVVWLTAAIMMAITAGRFMFNAAPAFAISAGWILVIVVDALDFGSVRKSLSGASGSFFQVFKKSVKVRHVVGVLFLGFLIVLPNVWYSMDAGMPSETKQEYDKQVYYSLPQFMRPEGYDTINGSNWYFGAFGYSLPLESYYFPAAWSWFAQQDSEIYPEVLRPAYVAWWDYGFEAVQEGEHPTVADNFQNGYELTGNALMAQSEEDAIALFAYRLLSAGMRKAEMTADLTALMEEHGIDTARMTDILSGPTQPLKDDILYNPDVYGPMADDLGDVNARIVAGRVELVKLGVDSLVEFYSDLCDLTGWSIRYFMADSRMFPISGSSTGIFYAPAKLSDRRIDDYGEPYDFYTIKAVDSNGRQYDLEDITPDMSIVNYAVVYTEMFYDSMFYRAMGGFSGADIGLQDEGVPGESGTLSQYTAMPGWNMTHFAMVYRTAYYNPWPSDQVALHANDWRAISLEEAVALEKQISAGDTEGVVDRNPSSLYRSGASFLKYYEGAVVEGTVTTEQGEPVPNVRVTVQDSYGIPHQVVSTDADGHYSVLATAGNITIALSMGSITGPTLVGSNSIAKLKINVTDDQAMRVERDLDGNGIIDYYFTKDYVMRGTKVTGDLFWDVDSDNNYTSGTDELLQDATVYATETTTGKVLTIDAPEGSIDGYLPPGQYDFVVNVLGGNITMALAYNVTAGDTAELKLPVQPATVAGGAYYRDQQPASGIELTLRSSDGQREFSTVTASDGSYMFGKVLPGEYQMVDSADDLMLFEQYLSLASASSATLDLTLYESAEATFKITVDGGGAPYAVYMFQDKYDPSSLVTGTADHAGLVVEELPLGEWTLYAICSNGTEEFADARLIELTAEGASGVLELDVARNVVGALKNPKGSSARNEYITFGFPNGARVGVKVNRLGSFDTRLPAGTYDVISNMYSSSGWLSTTITVGDEDIIGLAYRATEGVQLSGTLYLDTDSTGQIGSEDLGHHVRIALTDSSGRVFTERASANGSFSIVVPKASSAVLSISEAGYAGWSETLLYATSQLAATVIAEPDPVAVTGKVSYDGLAVGGVHVTFVPSNVFLETVEAVSGAGGYYTAYVLPSLYTVTIDDQISSGVTDVRYQLSEEFNLLPGADPVMLDLLPVKRAEVSGTVLGASYSIELEFSGPEEISADLDLYSYSVYLMPGTYQVYASGMFGAYPYAAMETVEVVLEAMQYDIQLSRAYNVSGMATIEGEVPYSSVSVTATSSTGSSATVQSTRVGQYYLTLTPGTYTLTYVLEAMDGESGQMLYVEYNEEKTVTVGSANLVVPADLAMRMDNTTFSGTVYTASGVPGLAKVELMATSGLGMNHSFYTSASGEFSESVQPGEYTIKVTRLQDRGSYLDKVTVSRNMPLERDLYLSSGRYLSGVLTVSDEPATDPITLTTGPTAFEVLPSEDGSFSVLVPEGNYTLTCTTTREEGGLSVYYTRSYTAAVSSVDVYVDFSLLRDTRRTVTGSWNEATMRTALPGDTLLYVFTVENTGNIEDTYTFSSSTSGFTVTFIPSELYLNFGDLGNVGTVVAEITVGETLPYGKTELKVTAKSKAQATTRGDVRMYVEVLPVHSVDVYSLNKSEAVSSSSTVTKFSLNNTGNVDGRFGAVIINSGSLAEQGWTAKIVDPDTGEEFEGANITAFGSKELKVQFTATRSNPDPTATADVKAYQLNDSLVNGYGSVPVIVPDLSIGPGDLDVVRDDVSYEYDASRIYVDLALVITLVGLVAMLFIMRRRKGLGGGGKK